MEQKTKYLRVLLALSLVISLGLYYERTFTAHLRTPLPKMSFITIGSDPSTQMILGWETAIETQAKIEYGFAPNEWITSVMEPEPAIYHHHYFTNLIPDTEYHYQISIKDEIFSTGSFKTAPANPLTSDSTARFCLVADTQPKMGPGWHSLSAKMISQENYDFVGLIGDFLEDGVKEEWWDFFSRASAYLQNTPFVPVRGNHDKPRDITGDGILEYSFEKYFPQTVDTVKNLNEYDTHNQFYYSFNWSNVHVQILHFPEMDIDDVGNVGNLNPRDYYQSFTEDHINWIKADLERAQSIPFRISLFHVPITGAGFYGPNYVLIEELLPILHEYNVTATFHGHAHHYDRGLFENPIHKNRPMHFFGVGTGGGLTDIGLRPVPEVNAVLGSPLYTEVIANATAMVVRARSFDGIILDQITILASGGYFT